MAVKRIAIIGAGPKAAALATKADLLNRFSGGELAITIFEQSAVAANWTGEHGYTDGEARLCTPAERDLGFPYDVGVAEADVAAHMYSAFSWGAYLVRHGRHDARTDFKNWVNRGRLPPTHAEFASYVGWAIKKSSADVIIAEVQRLEPRDDGWWLDVEAPGSPASTEGPFNGVVLTGPGEPKQGVEVAAPSDRMADGRTFWRNPDKFLAQATGKERTLVILGAGGTSAAIAARAVRAREIEEIVIIGDRAALFTRAEAFFENQIFTDPAVWKKLDGDTRRDFTDRLNRGVVWASISSELARSPKVRFEPGRGKRMAVTQEPPGPAEVLVEYERGGERLVTTAALAIDAAGFDPWWFVRMLPDGMRALLEGETPEATKVIRRDAQIAMSPALALFDEAPGPIHAPMLSQSVGPGYASLMALGAMSDVVLNRYMPSYIAP